MDEIIEALEKAGFKDVDSLCNVYTAVIPETKTRVFITINKKEMTYAGSFVKTYKKPKDYEAFFKAIKKLEIENNSKEKYTKYTEKIYLNDGVLYNYADTIKVYALKNNTAIVEINGKKYYIDHTPDPILEIIETKNTIEEAAEEIERILTLL